VASTAAGGWVKRWIIGGPRAWLAKTENNWPVGAFLTRESVAVIDLKQIS
jgi:hypothetical protein